MALAILVTAAVAAQPRQFRFTTAPPALLEPDDPSAPGQRLLTYQEYREWAARPHEASVVTVHGFPGTLSPNAGFGLNFIVGGKNLGFAVDGSEAGGYALYADVSGDGSLKDEPAIRLEKREGYYTALLRPSMTATTPEAHCGEPVSVRFLFASVQTPSGPRLAWRTIDRSIRRGTIDIAGRRTAFALVGRPGQYDQGTVWIDLNGDGQGMATVDSLERFRPTERRFTLAGTGYAYDVDPCGGSLGLTRLDEEVPDRPSLEPGSSLPDFSVTDVEGKLRRLADYRGKVLLIDFWATWCGPCREEAPNLVALYRRYRDRGLEILGVSTDAPDEIWRFASQFGQDWPQVSETDEGTAHRLFRVNGLPTHVLIDRHGRVIRKGDGDFDFESVERLVRIELGR
jgi:peroxiredoxin